MSFRARNSAALPRSGLHDASADVDGDVAALIRKQIGVREE